MVVAGVFLGVVVVVREGGVPLEDVLGAVLRHAQAAVGVQLMELVEPGAVVLHIAHVPAEVMVVALHIGDVGVLGVHGNHGHLRHGGQAGGVQLLAQGVQLGEVLVQALGLARDGDLVGDAPEEDGGMVVVLGNQLGHLGDGVVVGFLGGDELADEGDLRPQGKAGVVAQVIEILVMLIVGQTDGVGADLLDEGDILLVVRLGERPALVLTVLMAGNAVQRHILAVEPEAGVGVHMEGTVADGDGHGIHGGNLQHIDAGAQAGLHGVAVGVRHAVPQVGVLHVQLDDGVRLGLGLAGGHHLALGVLHIHGHGVAVGVHREQVDAGLAVGAGRDEHTGGAVLEQRKVGRLHLDEVDVTVQAAVEGKVGVLGIDVALGVGHHHGEHVALRLHGLGEVEPEGGKAALVGAQLAAVAVHGGHVVGALELDVLALALGGGGQVDLVGADAPPVIVAAVLAVQRVPGMGQRHGGEGFALLGKQGLG